MESGIIKVENISLIVQDAPKAYEDNKLSHDRCLDFGKALLAQIQATGMTDELDQQASTFINKARATIKKMNEKRSPLTKLFDEIRTTFTGFENDIDPAKKDTVPYQLQQLRNQFAAVKREEEERKRREETLRLQRDNAKRQYKMDVEQYYDSWANDVICSDYNFFAQAFGMTTLENYDEHLQLIRSYKSVSRGQMPIPNVIKPALVPIEELNQILSLVKESMTTTLLKKINDYLENTRQQYLDMMPSKKAELERAANASAEEAEKIRQQMAQRDAEEAARKEQELRGQREAERKQSEMQSQVSAMGDLFDGAAAGVQSYQPKSSVKKSLVPLNVEAFPEILSLWWQKEGCKLSVEELKKMFKKQITFCEKRAKDGELINSEHIQYIDEVEAK